FDQVSLDKEWVSDQMLYLKENDDAEVVLYEERPISLELPPQVELKVAYTEPWKKGGTVAGQYKAAKMETGLELQVPPFVDFGDGSLDKEWVSDQMLYLKENDDAEVVLYEERPISLELPPQVELKVAYTEPWKKGGTVAGQYKAAKMETGLELQVPPFVDIGD